ncbi:MAG: peroxiredoxin [Halieaceae bacterium]|jgi:peroxiredoxin
MQLVKLQEISAVFHDAGIGIVAITYDAPELQQPFIDEFSISYPLLSDIDATTIRSLGILNTDQAPEDDHYGIPWPGIFIVNPAKEIVGKIFLEGYSTRVSAEAVLDYAQDILDPSKPG